MEPEIKSSRSLLTRLTFFRRGICFNSVCSIMVTSHAGH